MSVQAVATAQRSFDLAVDWAQNRHTFGQPLDSRQVIRHRLAEMARQVQSAWAYVRDVVTQWANGEEVAAEVAMAENTAVYVCNFVVDEALQIHGGMGFMRESEVERHHRDARVLGVGGDTNEMMNEIIAKKVLQG